MIKKDFLCMASRCEVLIDTTDPLLAENVFQEVKAEAGRVEHKYSRYRDDNIVFKINNSKGKAVEIDDETASLLDFAFQCFDLSDGMFDITSGVLRKIWNFKEVKKFPEDSEIKECLEYVGLKKLKWNRPYLQLKKGMEIDFGGIVKEYAVDRCLALAATKTKEAVLINFGGDLASNRKPAAGKWSVGIEEAFKRNLADSQLQLKAGALATSGDTHRFFEHDGKRYSHILNPMTGLPVSNGVSSITVFAPTCTMAGVLSTVSHLQKDPESYLKNQSVPYWIVKHDALNYDVSK